MQCGQKLDWADYDDMRSVYILAHDSSEAAYWAEKYQSECGLEVDGTVYGIDIEEWRLSLKEFPMILFFPFQAATEYGRFMRAAAKEATII